MPLISKKMQKRFPKQRTFLHGFFLCVFAAGTGFFLYQQTDQRLVEKPSKQNHPGWHDLKNAQTKETEEVKAVAKALDKPNPNRR